MLRVANLAQFETTMANVQRTQSALATNQIQLATGKKAQAYSEIATQASELVSLERSLDRSDQFKVNINDASIKLNTIDSALSVMVDRATEVKSIISNALSGSNIDDLPLQQFAASFSTEVANLLNTQLGGQYIFAGSLTDTSPVDLADPAYDPQAGLPGVFAPDTDYFQGDDFIATARADDNFELAYGITADDPAFEQLLRAFSYLDYAGANSDQAVLTEAFQLVENAIDGLSNLRGQVGANSQVLEKARQGHEDFQTFAGNIVSNIEDVDIAQATSELAFNEVQLQGAFLSIARIQNLSLLEFL
jgi:flagellar hook-associated protein 3 FlgL